MSILGSRLRWAVVALLNGCVAASVFATQPRPMYTDAGGFILVGRGLLSGQAPYTGIWDDKPPGVYLIGLLAWLLDPGDTTVSMQALTIVAIAVAATACGWLLWALSGRFWVGVGTGLAAAGGLSVPSLSGGGGSSEVFGVAGLALCTAAIVAMLSGRRRLSLAAVAGGAFAWAIGSSLLTASAVPALGILWLSLPVDGSPYRITSSNWRSWLRRRVLDRRLGIAVAGAAVVSAVVWWPVLSSGAGPAAVDTLIRYNGLYRGTGVFTAREWINGMGSLWPLWLPTLIVCLIPTGRRRVLLLSLVRSNVAWAMALWVVAAVALLAFGRRLYPHYLLVLVPALAVLFGLTLSAAAAAWKPRIGPAAGVALCVAAAVGLVWQSPPASPTNADAANAANAELAAYVRANSAPDDTIYAWGYDPDIYLRSDRDPAGPYFYVVPLVMPGYDQEAVAAMLRAWQAHPPRLVLTGGCPDSALIRLDELDKPPGYTNPGEPSEYGALDPLREFIRAHYEVAATLRGGRVWRHRG